MLVGDGWLDAAPGSTISMAIEPNTSLVLCKAHDSKVPDSVLDSESSAPLPIEPDWAPIMEFTAADVFQPSPFGNILNSLKSLSLSGEPWPDYGQQGWDAYDEEIRCPPTTHFVATVDDLTDMLDFDSEDIDGMDNDAGDEQEPPPTKKAMATRQRRMTPPRSNPSADVSAAALSPAIAKVVIPAQETITLWIVPKTTTIPSSTI